MVSSWPRALEDRSPDGDESSADTDEPSAEVDRVLQVLADRQFAERAAHRAVVLPRLLLVVVLVALALVTALTLQGLLAELIRDTEAGL